jgi:hypothetical protein
MLTSSTFELSISGWAKPEWLAREFDDARSKAVRKAGWKYVETGLAHANVNRTTRCGFVSVNLLLALFRHRRSDRRCPVRRDRAA